MIKNVHLGLQSWYFPFMVILTMVWMTSDLSFGKALVFWMQKVESVWH